MNAIPLLISFVTVCLLLLLWTELKKVALSQRSWEELLSGLRPVHSEGITVAAIEYCSPDKRAHGLSSSDLWVMIGGWEGLRSMHANAGLLIALAGHAQGWNYQGTVDVAESMRGDAFAIRRAALSIAFDHCLRLRVVPAESYIQAAASRYYQLAEGVLALYESSPSRRYTRLEAAVWSYA